MKIKKISVAIVMLFFLFFGVACGGKTKLEDELIISQVYYSEANHLIIEYLNGTTKDLGSIDVVTNIQIVNGDLIVNFALGESQNIGKLTGSNGVPGADGRSVVVGTSETHIQWKYENDLDWHNLISFELLRGPKGDDGATGPKGEDGIAGPKGEDGAAGSKGEDGAPGVGIQSTAINQYGELIITYTDGKTANLGKIYNTYLVEFVDYNGYLLSVQYVVHGDDAIPPEIFPKEGMEFSYWLGDYKFITSPRRIIAQYNQDNIMSIADFIAFGGEEMVTIQGVITSLAPYNSYSFEDATASVALRIPNKNSNNLTYQCGDELRVNVKKTEYYGLIQAELLGSYDDIELISTGKSVEVFDLNNEALTNPNLRQYQSRLIKLNNLRIENSNVDSNGNITFNLIREDGAQISFRWDYRLKFANYSELAKLKIGDIVSLEGATLTWFNNAQVMIDNINQIIVEEGDYEEFKIFYLNDLHGAVLNNSDLGQIGLSRIANYINKTKDNNSLFITGGDIFQGQLISNDNRGALIVKILNELNLDAFVIGNHEFDWGLDLILEYFNPNTSGIKANFPILGANVVLKSTGKRPDFIDSHVIINRGNTKIGIIGVIGENLESSISYLKVKDYEFTNAYAAVSATVNLIKDDVDFILVVNHDENTSFNNAVAELPKVAAVFNGHTHHEALYYVNSKSLEAIPVIQSSANGRMIGEVDLKFLKNENIYSLVDAYAQNVKTSPYLNVEDQKVKDIINSYYEEIYALYTDIILIASKTMNQGALTQFISRLMLEVTGSIAGFQNIGGVRSSLVAGQEITNADIFQILPFDNQIIVVEVDGLALIALLNDDYFTITSEIEIYEIDENSIYQVATNDYIYYSIYNAYAFANTYGTEILFGDMYEIFCEVLLNFKDHGNTHFDPDNIIIYYPA